MLAASRADDPRTTKSPSPDASGRDAEARTASLESLLPELSPATSGEVARPEAGGIAEIDRSTRRGPAGRDRRARAAGRARWLGLDRSVALVSMGADPGAADAARHRRRTDGRADGAGGGELAVLSPARREWRRGRRDELDGAGRVQGRVRPGRRTPRRCRRRPDRPGRPPGHAQRAPERPQGPARLSMDPDGRPEGLLEDRGRPRLHVRPAGQRPVSIRAGGGGRFRDLRAGLRECRRRGRPAAPDG